jgi:hypothetical protein
MACGECRVALCVSRGGEKSARMACGELRALCVSRGGEKSARMACGELRALCVSAAVGVRRVHGWRVESCGRSV